jgi:hypothetical protein
MFSAIYGKEITKQVFAYVRQKQTRAYDLPLKQFKMGNQIVTVEGADIGSAILVWKPGVVLQ